MEHIKGKIKVRMQKVKGTSIALGNLWRSKEIKLGSKHRILNVKSLLAIWIMNMENG